MSTWIPRGDERRRSALTKIRCFLCPRSWQSSPPPFYFLLPAQKYHAPHIPCMKRGTCAHK